MDFLKKYIGQKNTPDVRNKVAQDLIQHYKKNPDIAGVKVKASLETWETFYFKQPLKKLLAKIGAKLEKKLNIPLDKPSIWHHIFPYEITIKNKELNIEDIRRNFYNSRNNKINQKTLASEKWSCEATQTEVDVFWIEWGNPDERDQFMYRFLTLRKPQYSAVLNVPDRTKMLLAVDFRKNVPIDNIKINIVIP